MSNLEKTIWSAPEYASNLTPKCTGQNEKVEANLLKKFPPIHNPTQYEFTPHIVTDVNGKGLEWYLPGILTEARAVSDI
jgi:hypothetical protein